MKIPVLDISAIAVLLVLLAVLTSPVWLVFAYIAAIRDANTYKSVVQEVELVEKSEKFVLMADLAGFGDPAWYVYRLRAGEMPSEAMRTAHDTTDVLFWNYAEGGDDTADPRIELVGARYLAFMRGGLYHSLYDIEGRRVVINEESPWHTVLPGPGSSLSVEDHGNLLRKWKLEKLHGPISRILEVARNGG